MNIIKYKNRKLYDSENSKSITLKDLESDIKNFRDIRVCDIEGNDITKETLVMILVNKVDRLTVEDIVNLIRKE